MYKTIVRNALVFGMSLATSLIVVSCATSPNQGDDRPTTSSSSVSSKSDKDIKLGSAQAVEKLYNTTLNPQNLDKLSSLSSKEDFLLKKTGNHHAFDSLSSKEKNEAIDVANKVYELEDNFYKFDDLSPKEKEDLVITITAIHNNFKDGGVKELSVEVDSSLVEEQGKMQAYIPAQAIDLKLDGKEFESSDFVVIVENDTFLIDPQRVIEEYRKSVQMIDKHHDSTNTTSNNQEGIASPDSPVGEENTDSSLNAEPPTGDGKDQDLISKSDSLPDIINNYGDVGELMDNSLKELGYSIQDLQGEAPEDREDK